MVVLLPLPDRLLGDREDRFPNVLNIVKINPNIDIFMFVFSKDALIYRMLVFTFKSVLNYQ